MARLNEPARANWVPKRMMLYKDRPTRWLVQEPHHLLAWWLFLGLFSLVGIVLAVTVMPVYNLPAFIMPTWLPLVADIRYIPRAFHAWRGGDDDGAEPTPLGSLTSHAAHSGASRSLRSWWSFMDAVSS